MRVSLLHVIRSVDRSQGGTVEAMLQLSEELVKHGHAVEVASLDLPGAECTRNFPIPLHALGASESTYGGSNLLVPWLKANASRFQGVLVHGLWQYHGFATWKALRHSSTPYYVYPHGMLDRWFRQAYPLKHLKKTLYWKLIEHRVLRDARAILYTCEEERKLGRATFSPYAGREEIMPLGTATGKDPLCLIFQSELLRQRIEWFPTLELDSLDLVARYVAEGFGIGLTLVPPGAPIPPGTRAVRLENFPSVPFGVIWIGRMSPLQQEIVEEAQKITASMV